MSLNTEVAKVIEALDCGCPGATSDCSCSELTDRLFELVDQEISNEDWHRLMHHVQNCAECTHSVKMEVVVRKLVRRGCVQEAPSALRERLVNMCRESVNA